MKLKLPFVLASILVIGAGCVSAPAPEPTAVEPSPEQAAAPSPAVAPTPEPPAPTPEAPFGRAFTVVGENYEFDVKEMRVKKGDTVRVTFKNAEGFHDWRLDEFNAATQRLQAGGEETIEFVADKTGTYEYYCSVGKHRQMGMKGNLIVE